MVYIVCIGIIRNILDEYLRDVQEVWLRSIVILIGFKLKKKLEAQYQKDKINIDVKLF